MVQAKPVTLHVTDFYGDLLHAALQTPGLVDDPRLAIDNILSGQSYYRKSFLANPLSDLSFYLTVLDSGALGFAYHNGQPGLGKTLLDLVDVNALEVLQNQPELDLPLRVSILDGVYGYYNQIKGFKPDAVLSCNGAYKEKADFRSKLVIDQLRSGTKVLLIGLVTEFVRDMVEHDIEVFISDLSPELEGQEVYGVPVINSGNDWTLESLAQCDAAIVTGASISTDTIDSIFEVAAAHNTELHFYLETGNNFGPQLIQRGATSVIAEKFPFYDLPGETRFEVYAK